MHDVYLSDINAGDCYELWDETIAYVVTISDRYVECNIRERAAPNVCAWCLYTLFDFRLLVRSMYMEG